MLLSGDSCTVDYVVDRKKVLKHHPDKKAGVAGDSNDDAFFKCIQKAMEVLTHPERRRQFGRSGGVDNSIGGVGQLITQMAVLTRGSREARQGIDVIVV